MDVVFLLDATKASLFNDMKDFIKSFSHKFVVEPMATRIGLVSYGSDASIIFGFTRYCCRKELDEGLDKLDYTSFVTRRTITTLDRKRSDVFKTFINSSETNNTRRNHFNTSHVTDLSTRPLENHRILKNQDGRGTNYTKDLLEKRLFTTAFKKEDSTSAAVLGRGLFTASVLFHDPTVRPDVPHILIVLSYAPSADNFLLPSMMLRNEAVDIFGVGVGKYFSKIQLLHMTSLPKFRHLFKTKTSSQLKCLAAHVADKVIQDIQWRICPACLRGKLSFSILF